VRTLRVSTGTASLACKQRGALSSFHPACGQARPALTGGLGRGAVQITSGMVQPSLVMVTRPLTRLSPGKVSYPYIKKWRADSCSRKRDNEPHRDHGVQAGNGKAEPNLGHGALGALRPKVYPPALHALLRATNVTKIRMRERRNRSVHKAYPLHVTRSSPCHKGARSRPADWSNGTAPGPSRPPIGRTLVPRSKRKVSGRFRLHASAAAPSEGPPARCRCRVISPSPSAQLTARHLSKVVPTFPSDGTRTPFRDPAGPTAWRQKPLEFRRRFSSPPL